MSITEYQQWLNTEEGREIVFEHNEYKKLLIVFEAGQRAAASQLSADVARAIEASQILINICNEDWRIRDRGEQIHQEIRLRDALEALTPASLAAVEAALKAVPE